MNIGKKKMVVVISRRVCDYICSQMRDVALKDTATIGDTDIKKDFCVFDLTNYVNSGEGAAAFKLDMVNNCEDAGYVYDDGSVFEVYVDGFQREKRFKLDDDVRDKIC